MFCLVTLVANVKLIIIHYNIVFVTDLYKIYNLLKGVILSQVTKQDFNLLHIVPNNTITIEKHHRNLWGGFVTP